jgi:carotenoid cleavage dioxygenase
LAFGEQGLPWSIDPVTLETLEEWTFGGSLNQVSPLSAHPHFDPVTGEMVTFGVSFAATQPTLQLYRFGADGSLRRRDRVPLPMPASIHDFALSAGHAVFWVSPYLLDFRRMREGGSVMDALEWCPEIGSRLLVVRRDDGQVVAEVPVGKGYSLHSINAHEPEPGRIVLDVIELDEPAYPSYMLDELLAAAPLGRPVRLEIDLARNQVVQRTTCRFDWAPDFPVIAPSTSGRQVEHVWMLGMSQARRPDLKFFDTLARVAWSQPEATDLWQAAQGDFLVGEAAVAEAPAGEADLVLCPLFDAATRHTRLAVFRALEIAAGPIATVDFGTSFAPGFHGCWVPA